MGGAVASVMPRSASRQPVAEIRDLLGIEVGVKVDELAPTQAQDTCIPSLTLASTRLGINYLLKPSSTQYGRRRVRA